MNSRSILDNRLFSTIILLALLCLVVSVWYWLPGYINKDLVDIKDKGVLGDSYGSVNALFTGLAFAGLIFTVLLQQREISLQRQDFKVQVSEMQLARKESARQADIQQRQVLLSIAQLKIKTLEVEVEKIKIESVKWIEGARYENVSPKLESVQNQMIELINEVSAKIT